MSPTSIFTPREKISATSSSPCRSTYSPKTSRIYLAALDRLIAHLEAKGMPTGTRAVRREHVESYFAERRESVAPATLSSVSRVGAR